MNKFVYVIYDKETAEIHEIFKTEEECVSKYVEFYEGFLNIDWMGMNLRFILKDFFHVGEELE